MAPPKDPFDLAVIGAGPGGYVAALRAAALGAKVALIERDQVGGVCLNRGCIPAKALLFSAQIYYYAKRAGEFGVTLDSPTPDLLAMTARMDKVVAQLRKGTELLLDNRDVNLIRGTASLLSPKEIHVSAADGEETLYAEKVILATGSTPARPPIPGADGQGVITSNEILWLPEIPDSLVIIGAGSIGMEFGSLFSTLGTKVTVIEMLPHILPTEDEEITQELARSLRRNGVQIHANARVTEIADKEDRKEVKFSENDKPASADGNLVLLAVGRVPYFNGLGLEKISPEREGRAIKVNARMETSVPGVYAIGDIVPGPQLAHKASAEGRVAAHNAAGQSMEMDYAAIPYCTYSHPEVASVGLNESQANEQGKEVKIGRFPYRALGRALTIGERAGLAKIVADAQTSAVLGAQLVGPHVSDIIAEAALAVKEGLSAEKLAETIHAHPTLPESLQEAAEDIFGLAIHKI